MPWALAALSSTSLLAACRPLQQPLGSLTPSVVGSGGTAGTAGKPDAGTPDAAPRSDAGPPTLTGTQIPDIPPEWNGCDPTGVNVVRCYQDPKVPSSPPPPGLFSGTADPDPTRKPVLVYPLAGSMQPINLADITFQWRRAPDVAQTIFRIRLSRINGDIFEFFVPCNHTNAAVDAECVYHLPPGAWLDLAQTGRGEQLVVDVTGVDPKRVGSVAPSDPTAISFTPEYVSGGFYYWSTSITGTMRLLFGGRTHQPFVVPKTASNPATCSGCHAVSHSGSTIAFTEGDTAAGVLSVAETTNVDKPNFTPATMHDSGTMALNSDGSRVIVSTAGRLFLRDAHTGAQILEVPPADLGQPIHGFHPDWSPDDKSIALTLSAMGASDWSVSTGAIGVLPYNNGAFGPVETLVDTGTDFNFYPTWSPDGHWIAFATAPVGVSMGVAETSYRQTKARLRLVNRDTHAVFELAAATGGVGRTSTWPKFAPGVQAGGLMFLTYNSRIDYGFYLSNNTNEMTGQTQLWMTTIDVRKLQTAASDPSSPPVWLPFQAVTERNYLGVWAEHIGCRVENGQSIGCGDHEICDKGACAMVTQ
ncbi:MAG TPA: hypothetical protein VHJ20_04140 [Polyangia bacterium]|nr:hypothetical protein [Polyangia bacterium]